MTVRLIHILFLFLLIIGGLEDKQNRRINNFLSISLILLGFINILGISSVAHYLNSIIPIMVGLVVLHIIGVIGGGDFKIFLASSLIIQPQCLILTIVLTILIGSIMMLTGLDNKPPLITIYALITFPYILAISIS